MKMKSWMSTVGSAGLAVVASACCWLPLLLLGLGAGTATVAGVTTSIEHARPVLVLVALPLLGVSWYLTYWRRPPVPAGVAGQDCCAVPTPGKRRAALVNRVTLPVATVAVLALAAAPHQVFAWLTPAAADGGAVAAAPALRLRVPGMT